MSLISAYRKDTGEKVRVPEHWMDHPTLGRPFNRTPSQRARDSKTPTTTQKAPAAGEKE